MTILTALRRLTLNASKKTGKRPATIELNVCTGKVVALKAATGDGLRRFDLEAYTGGVVNLPQYDIPVVFDLSSMRLQPNLTQLPLLKDHNNSRGIGHAETVSIDVASGVSGVGVMSVPGMDRDTVIEAADNGKEWQLSVGGTAVEEDIRYVDEGESFTANNRTLHGPALHVSNYLLREITFVEAGADATGAFATLIASFKSTRSEGNSMNFEQWLQSLGVKLDTLSAVGLASMRKQFAAETSADGDGELKKKELEKSELNDGELKKKELEKGELNDGELKKKELEKGVADSAGTEAANQAVADSIRQAAGEASADEVERSESLSELNASFGNPQIKIEGEKVSLLAHALRKGWNADKFELTARRNQRPQKMSGKKSSNDGSNNRVAMLAAMTFCIMGHASANVQRDYRGDDSAREYLNASLMLDPESAARDQAMNAAHNFRHHSLIDLMASAMELDGVECTAPKKSDKWFKAAFSSNAVTDLFTQSVQAVLLDTFMQHMQTYDIFANIVDEVDVPNFMTNERKTVSPDTGELERLESTGTAGDAKMSAGGEEYKISRFAKRWGIDEQDAINESFGVFRTMPQFLGKSAARLYGQSIAKLLLTNPNMKDGDAWLSTGAGNLRTGSPLNRANYLAASQQFGLQQDGDVSLELEANIAMVPNKTLRIALLEILSGAAVVTGENKTTTSQNVLADDLDHVYKSALLHNGFSDPDDRKIKIAGDPTSWWLFDGNYKSIEMGHLQSTGRGVAIRTGEYTDGRYGTWFDVKRDLGTAPIRRESVQKNEE